MVLVLLLFGPVGLVIYLATEKRNVESTTSRWTRFGVFALGLIGGVAGVVLGLVANPPTAWFAVIELGLPSALLGGLLGLVSGALAVDVDVARTTGRPPSRTARSRRMSSSGTALGGRSAQ